VSWRFILLLGCIQAVVTWCLFESIQVIYPIVKIEAWLYWAPVVLTLCFGWAFRIMLARLRP
jgi:hypothetical protein